MKDLYTSPTKQLEDIKALTDELGLEAYFNYNPIEQDWKDIRKLQLNWKVTLRSPRGSMEFEYHAGIGHLKGFNTNRLSVDEAESIRQTVKTGLTQRIGYLNHGKPIPNPSLEDVLYCLVMDSDVFNYSSFEDWASDLGYDTDSIKASKIYQACLEEAKNFLRVVGMVNIDRLREAFQDY